MDKSDTQFTFHFEPEPVGGIRSGANDGRLHQFTSLSAAESVVRESIQNSLDAIKPGADKVEVEFEIREFPTSEIPGIEDLRHAAKSAWEFNKDNAGSDSLKAASDALAGSVIKVLRIGDYGTTGLTGYELEEDDGKPSPLVALILGDGLSSKRDGQGGSFGIGASAMIRASAARTVGYVTMREDGSSIFASRSLLARHRDQLGDLRRKDGIYRSQSGEFPRGVTNIGSFAPRTESGTDIYVYAYDDESLLQGIQDAVISNFMVAVHFGKLEVRIITDSTVQEIRSNNLENLIRQSPDNDENWLEFFELLTTTEPIIDSIEGLGEVKLYLEAREDKKYGIQLMRKPLMLVRNFKPRGLSISYIGIFICDNEEGNAVLQSMEPPSHSDWERTGDRGNATIRNRLDRFLKDHIRALIPALSSVEIDPEGLHELLPQQQEPQTPEANIRAIVGGGTRSKQTTTEREDFPTLGSTVTKIRVGEIRPQIPSVVEGSAISNPDGTEDVRRGEHDGPNNPSPPNPSPDIDIQDSGTAGDGKSRIDAGMITWRSFSPAGTDETVVVIQPKTEATGDLTFVGVGTDRQYDVDIEQATLVSNDQEVELETHGGTIKNLSLAAGSMTTLKLRFSTGASYVLEVAGD